MHDVTHDATHDAPRREPETAMGRAAGGPVRGGRGRWGSRAGALGVVVLGGLASAGCSLDGLLNSDELPPHVSDPAITQTPAGARAAYVGTLARFRVAFGGPRSFVSATGLLSDELQPSNLTSGLGSTDALLDRRTLPEGEGSGGLTYSALQQVRGQAGQATGLLTRYLPDQPALVGHLYALQGYAEVFLAELFCSGVPLSTLDYAGDFTYRPGSSTEEVLVHAVALFDTALALAGDSARVMDLARMGRGRALLGLDSVASAAAAVAAVADGYRYNVVYSDVPTLLPSGPVSWTNFARTDSANNDWPLTVTNREGLNGLDWRTSGDPRTQVTQRTAQQNSISPYTYYHPNKYVPTGSSAIVLASGVEARLIEAEAALRAGDAATWLLKLNQLRQTAISPALPDTTDPGTAAGRVDLLFRERAFWLFLTGHRQGDLRRLIRQYGRSQGDVYPVGSYPVGGVPYGAEVTVPIPPTELVNPLYTGCASRGA